MKTTYQGTIVYSRGEIMHSFIQSESCRWRFFQLWPGVKCWSGREHQGLQPKLQEHSQSVDPCRAGAGRSEREIRVCSLHGGCSSYKCSLLVNHCQWLILYRRYQTCFMINSPWFDLVKIKGESPSSHLFHCNFKSVFDFLSYFATNHTSTQAGRQINISRHIQHLSAEVVKSLHRAH